MTGGGGGRGLVGCGIGTLGLSVFISLDNTLPVLSTLMIFVMTVGTLMYLISEQTCCLPIVGQGAGAGQAFGSAQGSGSGHFGAGHLLGGGHAGQGAHFLHNPALTLTLGAIHAGHFLFWW